MRRFRIFDRKDDEFGVTIGKTFRRSPRKDFFSRSRKGGATRRPVDRSTRVRVVNSKAPGVVARLNSFKNDGPSAASILAQHAEYLDRESATTAITSEAASFGSAELSEFRKFGGQEKRVWKFVISPKDGFAVSLNLMGEVLMEKLKAIAGKRRGSGGMEFEWSAQSHYNTAQPHLHVLIRGRDKKNKKDVLFHREVIKELSHIMTEAYQELLPPGYELTADMVRSRANAYSTARSEIDPFLMKHVSGKNIGYDELIGSVGLEQKMLLHTRLTYLTRTGLCSIKKGVVSLKPGFEDSLTRMRDFQRDLVELSVLQYSDKRTKFVFENNGSVSNGKLTSIVERKWDGALFGVLETIDGLAVPFALKSMDDLKGVKKGDYMRLNKGVVEPLTADRLGQIIRKTRSRGALSKDILEQLDRSTNDGIGL